MKKDADKPRPRSRTRKKQEPVAVTPTAPPASSPPINVGSLESAFSLLVGVLLVVGALFPRSLKQVLMLSLGGGLVYRGMTAHCGLYELLGIDTEKGSLIGQINDKYLSGAADKGVDV